jgi:hypothetical protein
MDLVEAIAQRDAVRAVQLVRDHHSRVITRTRSAPLAKEIRETGPGLAAFRSSCLRLNVRLGHQPGDRDSRAGHPEADFRRPLNSRRVGFPCSSVIFIGHHDRIG